MKRLFLANVTYSEVSPNRRQFGSFGLAWQLGICAFTAEGPGPWLGSPNLPAHGGQTKASVRALSRRLLRGKPPSVEPRFTEQLVHTSLCASPGSGPTVLSVSGLRACAPSCCRSACPRTPRVLRCPAPGWPLRPPGRPHPRLRPGSDGVSWADWDTADRSGSSPGRGLLQRRDCCVLVFDVTAPTRSRPLTAGDEVSHPGQSPGTQNFPSSCWETRLTSKQTGVCWRWRPLRWGLPSEWGSASVQIRLVKSRKAPRVTHLSVCL